MKNLILFTCAILLVSCASSQMSESNIAIGEYVFQTELLPTDGMREHLRNLRSLVSDKSLFDIKIKSADALITVKSGSEVLSLESTTFKPIESYWKASKLMFGGKIQISNDTIEITIFCSNSYLSFHANYKSITTGKENSKITPKILLDFCRKQANSGH